ncbi:hypothetical protein DPMN_029127 [Dreissena polymorpha]|uniref:Uncharacterized protein n=1 Tax=Dreissena polymorpha TaxID=45954 RepID=A0A9D4LVW7_DREPO|nr:hypothetical protein DPMN_029127 [Dreissena polymorpha]
MLKLAQTNQQTNQPTDQPTNRQGKNNMSPTTIVGDIKMSDNIDNITFNILWDDIIENDMEDASLKTANKTADMKIEENGTIKSQSAYQIVQEVSFEVYIELYGFDARVLDDTFENVTSNEVASILIPELNKEFEDIDICMVKKRI